MSDIIHDESHLLLLPREDERETFDRLDRLLDALLEARVSPSVAATLIGEHIALLTANLQKVPADWSTRRSRHLLSKRDSLDAARSRCGDRSLVDPILHGRQLRRVWAPL